MGSGEFRISFISTSIDCLFRKDALSGLGPFMTDATAWVNLSIRQSQRQRQTRE